MEAFDTLRPIEEGIGLLAHTVSSLEIINSSTRTVNAILLRIIPEGRQSTGHTALSIKFGLIGRTLSTGPEGDIIDLILRAAET